MGADAKEKRAGSTVGRIGGRNRQVRGGVGKGLSGSVVLRHRGGHRQARA